MVVMRWLTCLLVASLSAGCHFFSGTTLQPIASASGRPSNVAALVAVTRDDHAVSGLPLSSFSIEEDGQSIDAQSADVRLLEPGLVAAFHTVLLLDLGHGTSEQKRRELARAAGLFVQRVRRGQSVTVLGFDGSPHMRMLGEYPLDPAATGPEQVDSVILQLPADRSRNLRGAVNKALQLLDTRLSGSQRPVKLGTLVLFTRGPDLAGRMSGSDFEEQLDGSGHQTILVHVAGDPTDEAQARLSTGGHVEAQSEQTLPIAFEESATATARLIGRYYLVSYCSPSRAGLRELKLTVTVALPDGKEETDSFVTEFDSTGFGPGCNSGRPPRFVVTSAPSRKSPFNGPASASGSPKPGAPTDAAPPNPGAEPAGSDPGSPAAGEADATVPPPNNPIYAQ